jgi:hypothetical protein
VVWWGRGGEVHLLPDSTAIHVSSRYLLRQVDEYLPADTPALPHPRELRLLTTNNVNVLPASVGGALKRLTLLDLANNKFARIPASVSQITTLHSLDLSYNSPLQLEGSDIATIAALPCLQALKIHMENFPFGFSCGLSPGILSAIKEQFPRLSVHSDHELEKVDTNKLMGTMEQIIDQWRAAGIID